MTDKERILMHIICEITMHEASPIHKCIDKSWFSKHLVTLEKRDYKKGDISVAITSSFREINDFTVGTIEEVKDDCVVIREFGTGRLCNYYNESFYTFDRSLFSPYQLLEGKQYKIYSFLNNYMKNSGCYFKSLKFDDNGTTARFEIREAFESECYMSITLDVSKPLKDIKRQINDWLSS